MGKRLTKFMPKYIRDFNLENRINKYLESDKKTLSPRYPSTIKYHQQQEANAPKIDEYSINMNVAQMAKKFEVKTASQDEIKSNKPLPQDRGPVEQFHFGYKEPKIIPHGKLTLKILDDIINQYKQNKTSEKVDELSNKYNLNKESIFLLTEYYRPFTTITANDTKKNKNEQKESLSNIFSNLKLLDQNKNTKK